jgi:hypothetical protein
MDDEKRHHTRAVAREWYRRNAERLRDRKLVACKKYRARIRANRVHTVKPEPEAKPEIPKPEMKPEPEMKRLVELGKFKIHF